MKRTSPDPKALLLFLLFVSTGCRKAARFPGFSKIVEQGMVTYWLDMSSVHKDPKIGGRLFTLLTSKSDGTYTIGEAFTNCSHDMKEFEGSSYTRSGNFSSTTTTHDDLISPVLSAACHVGLFGGDPTVEADLKQVLGGSIDDWTLQLTQKQLDTLGWKWKPSDVLKHWAVRSVRVESFAQAGKTMRLVVVGSVKLDTNWRPIISAFVFRQTGSKWALQASSPVVPLPDSGQLPPPLEPKLAVVKLGPEVTGFSFEVADVGSSESSENLAFFLPIGQSLEPAITITLSDSFESLLDKTDYRFGPEVFNDMYVIHEVTKENSDNETTEAASQCYFSNRKYECN